jgi:hypothetical protein
MLMDISEHHTEPIPIPAGNAFHAYLVRCLTVWLLDQGRPVAPLHAARVRRGLYLLTGVPSTGPLATLPTQEPPRRRRGSRRA